ncbi:GNAT family N-acetyltransferase [bacterium]|nr:GNAT family N-acetyltransferase [bacterium]
MIRLRDIRPEDRLLIKQMLKSTRHFTGTEIETALELVDAFIQKTDLSYQFIVAENTGGDFVGYGCWGQAPFTYGTYNIYWIAVSPESQKKGVGSKILSYMETQIMNAHGRLILIETSSSKAYRDARAFYEKKGYTMESRIRDFYKPKDDRYIYVKRFDVFY